AAQRAVGHDLNVSNLHAGVVAAPQDFSVVDASATDARPRKDANQAARRAAGTEAIFAIDARIDVIEDHRRATEFLLQGGLHFDVFPTEVGRVEDDAFVKIERACASQSDAAHRGTIEVGFGKSRVDRLDDAGQTAFRSLVSL